ncbi:hypothetical protein MCAP1_001239 [Malassezia caprae]|uniref:Uncharacterized protein n=1 Tax=Malassezia caprae TaxID=1381934 RepID=A0AAF0E5Q8_9BASI|nr:hypothetical protein MCAP1_001239 [Malassezia caprae]
MRVRAAALWQRAAPWHPVRARTVSILRTSRSAGDVALPATPETYMALRASAYQLQALPETSFDALITHAGRTGLSGLISSIKDDVLQHIAAGQGTLREQRLLLALLNVSSTFEKKLPLSPELVVRLATQLLRSASVDVMPPHVAAHVLRRALSIPRRDGVHHPLIPVLVQHLAATSTYPLLEEGLHVIEYSLQYGTADPATLMHYVSQTAQVDGERLGEHTLQQARTDGFAWRKWAREASGWMSVRPRRHSTVDLQTQALRISLWSLCCRVWLRLQRPLRFRAALTQLRAELHRAAQLLAPQALAPPPPSAHIVRGLLQSHLVHLTGKGTRNSVRAALVAMRSVDADDLVQLLPGVVQMLCDKALQLHDPRTAADALTLCLDAYASQPGAASASTTFARTIRPATWLQVLTHLASTSHHASARALLPYALQGAAAWPSPLHAQWLACLCALGEHELVRQLYLQWTASPGAPLDPAHRAAWLARAAPATELQGTYAECDAWLRTPDAPAPEPQRAVPRPLDSPLVRAPQSLLALVQLFGAAPRHKAPRDTTFAMAVRDDALVPAMTAAAVPHYHLTALMQASLMLGDRATARHILHKMHTCGYALDMKDMAVLLRGLCDVAPDDAVVALQALPSLADKAHLYAVVMARCLYHGHAALVDRVYALACERHLGAQVAQQAPAVVLATSNVSPPAYVHRAIELMRDGWQPDMSLLLWMIRSAARGLCLRDAGDAERAPGRVPRAARRAGLRAALHLYEYVAHRHDTVHLPTTRFLLYHVAEQARRRGTQSPAPWIARLDRLVTQLLHARLWTGWNEYRAIVKDTTLRETRTASRQRVLPTPLAHQLLLAYQALGDERGVSEVLDWMHTTAQVRRRDLARAPYPVLQHLASRAHEPNLRTKPWWHARAHS